MSNMDLAVWELDRASVVIDSLQRSFDHSPRVPGAGKPRAPCVPSSLSVRGNERFEHRSGPPPRRVEARCRRPGRDRSAAHAADVGAGGVMTSMQTTCTPPCNFTWRDAPDLMERLTKAQNRAAFSHQDILTFAGFFTERAELERHVIKCETRAAEYVPAGQRAQKAA